MNKDVFFPAILLLLLGLVFFAGGLTKKLTGYHDWNSVVYASSARSLIGRSETGEIFYQQDYPVLLPLTLSLSFFIFGINEWSVRLVPIFFTILTSFMLYLLIDKLINKKIGLMTAILYLNTPLIRYYGKIPVHETVLPVFVLLIFYTYWNWFKTNTLKNYLILLFCIFVAEQYGWPGYFPIPLITLHYYLFSRSGKRPSQIANFWFISIISFLLFLLTDLLFTGRLPLQSLWNIFITRAAFNFNDPFSFTWQEFFKKEFLWIKIYLTRVLSFAALFGFIIFFISLVKNRNQPKTGLLFFLGIFGCIYLLIFRQASFLHEYVIIYLFPFLSFLGALSVDFIAKRLKINWVLILIPILALMFLESRQFITDLEAVNHFYPAFELGTFIRKKTNPKEKILFLSKGSSKMYGVYFYFYANRNYDTQELTLDQFLSNLSHYKENYRFLVIDGEFNSKDNKLNSYLEKNYSYQKLNKFKIYQLN